MVQLLGLVLISFAITSLLLVPFIDLLFYLRERNRKNLPPGRDINSPTSKDTPIHNSLLGGKDLGTPVGGGILIIPIVIVLSLLVLYAQAECFKKDFVEGFPCQFLLGTAFIEHNTTDFFKINAHLIKEINVLIFTILAFGLVGLLDDVKKIFAIFSGKYAGLRARYLFLFQFVFATIIAIWLYSVGGLNNLFIPFFGNIVLGIWYIPIAILVIVSFTNAFNISDGLDGLSTGLLAICLFAFLVLAHSVFDPTLSVFVGVWIGALIAFLYFNVFPARIYLGDAGAFAFGATLAVVGLLSGKVIGLAVIGGVYVVIVASSLIQILGKRFLKRKIFPVAPIHMMLRYMGWEEPKIVLRFWLAGAIFAILGLWLSLLSR